MAWAVTTPTVRRNLQSGKTEEIFYDRSWPKPGRISSSSLTRLTLETTTFCWTIEEISPKINIWICQGSKLICQNQPDRCLKRKVHDQRCPSKLRTLSLEYLKYTLFPLVFPTRVGCCAGTSVCTTTKAHLEHMHRTVLLLFVLHSCLCRHDVKSGIFFFFFAFFFAWQWQTLSLLFKLGLN